VSLVDVLHVWCCPEQAGAPTTTLIAHVFDFSDGRYAQISVNPTFAYVNLNAPLDGGGAAGDAAASAWGFSGWAQDLAGVRYYFATDDNGHTDCFFPANDDASPATLDLSSPAFGFDYNPVNDSYIQAPLMSPSNESWTPVYVRRVALCVVSDGGGGLSWLLMLLCCCC
jgi:hypothetical protein